MVVNIANHASCMSTVYIVANIANDAISLSTFYGGKYSNAFRMSTVYGGGFRKTCFFMIKIHVVCKRTVYCDMPSLCSDYNKQCLL